VCDLLYLTYKLDEIYTVKTCHCACQRTYKKLSCSWQTARCSATFKPKI